MKKFTTAGKRKEKRYTGKHLISWFLGQNVSHLYNKMRMLWVGPSYHGLQVHSTKNSYSMCKVANNFISSNDQYEIKPETTSYFLKLGMFF